MSEIYNRIVNDLNKTRRDTMFSPSLLDSLSEEERKIVEKEIIKYCLLGDSVFFDYLGYLKCYDLQEVFNEESLKNLTTTKRALIYKRLYYITKNNLYIGRLYELSKVDINAYSILTIMYNKNDVDRSVMYPALERFTTINDTYRMMFETRCKNNVDNELKQL
jgi:hypothetical protein